MSKLNRKTSYTEFCNEWCVDDFSPIGKEVSEQLIKDYVSNAFDTIKIDFIRNIDFSFIDSLQYTQIQKIHLYLDYETDVISLKLIFEENDKEYEDRVKEWEERQKAKPTKEERARIKAEKELEQKKALFLKLKEELGE